MHSSETEDKRKRNIKSEKVIKARAVLITNLVFQKIPRQHPQGSVPRGC